MADFYHTQRAMRQMRRQALQRGVIAILDVGSSKTACLVLRFDGIGRLSEDNSIGSLAGQSGFRVIGAATTRSRGVQFGEITAMQETERAIRTAVQAAQKMAEIRVDHVIACFSGANPRSYGLDAQTELEGQVVTEHEVARVLAACEVPEYGTGREVLHAHFCLLRLPLRLWVHRLRRIPRRPRRILPPPLQKLVAKATTRSGATVESIGSAATPLRGSWFPIKSAGATSWIPVFRPDPPGCGYLQYRLGSRHKRLGPDLNSGPGFSRP